MEHIQNFASGMNKDNDNSLPRTNTYLDALNLRLNTDKGQSDAALQNVNGNSSFGSIPDTSVVYKATVGTLSSALSSNFIITINATTVNTSPTTYSETLENLVDLINDNFPSNIRAFLSEDESFLYLTSTDGTAITTFTVTTGSGATPTITTYIAAQTGLIPIGWTTIREEIILLTTNEVTASPTSGVGQIWKLTYDDLTLDPTYTLLYNNIINFTTFHPVAPTAITSRYENTNTKRIYWTDNYNQLRHFNTASSTTFIVDPTELDIQTPADITIPILKEITVGGITQVGVYQAAYRLKNESTVTTFSDPSNLVSTVEESEQKVVAGASSDTYIGADLGTTAGKTIHWEIRNLDTDYDRIEIVVLFYDTFNANPVIVLTHDELIPDDGVFVFSYSGNERLEVLTTDQFLLQTFAFSHCKTITTKDNRLLASNTRHTNIDFDYDARAYGFTLSSTQLDLQDSQGASDSYPIATGSAAEWALVSEIHDAINPAPTTYKYQRNSTNIGGTGPNITYSFGTFCVKADSTMNITATQVSPFARTNPRENTGIENLGVTNQDYPTNGTNDGLKYAYRSDLQICHYIL